MSITLTHLSGSDAGRTQQFEGDRIRVGRHPECELQFDPVAHAVVGTRHAEFTRTGGGRYVLRDLDSRNGTFIDGRPVTEPTVVSDGSVIQFGRGGPEVRFAGAPVVDPAPPATNRVAVAAGGGLLIEHIAGSRAGSKESVSGSVIRFGRDTGCEVRFDPQQDRLASSKHAELRLENGRYVLQDLGSSNGTFVNGERIRHRVLEPGDLIQFGEGGPQVRLSLPSAPPSAAPPTVPASFGSSPGTGTQAAPPPKQGPGERTVQVWINDAVEKARQNPGTQWVRKAVGEATEQSKRTTQKYAAGLVVLLVLVAGGILAKVRMDQNALRGDMVAHIGGVEQVLASQLTATKNNIVSLEGQMTALSGRVDNAATRAELQKLMAAERERAGRLEQQIADARTQISEVDAKTAVALRNFRDVARNVEKAVYMLAVYYPELEAINRFCSSFAVRADGLLYTNGHCNVGFDELLADASDKGIEAIPLAIRNGDPEAVFEVIDRGSHPDYDPHGDVLVNIDLAYLKLAVDEPLPQVIPMASAEEMASLGAGYEMAVYGYPGEFMNDTEPVATFLPGTIGRIIEDNTLIQHSALTSGGTSGSPLLNLNGEVVGINHAGRMHVLPTVATDEYGSVIMNSDGTPQMGVIRIERAGRAFGIHGRHLAEWLGTIR